MIFDKPIIIEIQNPDSEQWGEYFYTHASVNKTGSSEYLNAGAERSTQTLTFEVRHCLPLEAVRYNTPIYRIKYRGQIFNIKDSDLYMEDKRNNIKFVGESYGQYQP
jgi:SPP1 family predicted phage head-tail adaptor